MDNLHVEVDGGVIKGEILTNVLNEKPYYSFKGVPFASPPVDSLRFQPPKPVEKKWKGVRECTEDGDMCCQRNVWTGTDYEGSEDCLFLNVFFPVENLTNSLRPVMVFLYGGGFQMGSADSNMYGPDFLVAKDVVLVTLNYRVNAFGFLNLGIKECPGNVGLLDQRAGLIWVKKHIRKFTGDPENVTIFGESAGSASVSYHLLSPLSRGLFHKAILQSGCSFDSWAYMDPELSIERAFRLGKLLGFTGKNVKELHKFLLGVPAETLYKAVENIITPKESKSALPFAFVPSKEIVGAYEDKFLPSDPRTLLIKAPEVPILIGLNSSEGHITFMEGLKKLQQILKDPGLFMDGLFPNDLKTLLKDPAKLKLAKQKVRQFYLEGDTSDRFIANKISECFGDISFGRGHYQWLKTCLNYPMPKPTYVYQLDLDIKVGVISLMAANLPDYFTGSCHADDIFYLFNVKLLNSLVLPSKECMQVVETMTTIWTNFAKFGNPKVEPKVDWKPISRNLVSYCNIGTELRIQPGFIHEKRVKFWSELYLWIQSQSKL